ncbi:hypothetical protein ABMA27_009573 [Loxostege sticticalis]|uniref:Uncharacterized protein n=1 Tax=Loxostege sticticalis TaxID=481309 RepID=A0ABR3H8M8_LOXSC
MVRNPSCASPTRTWPVLIILWFVFSWKALKMCIFMTLVGYRMGWSAPIILKLQDDEQTPLPLPITDGQASWVASVLYIGTIIVNFAMIIAARILIGLATGIIFVISFVYLGEIAVTNTTFFYIYRLCRCRKKEAKDALILLGRQDKVTKVITSQTEKQTVVTDWKELFTIRENRKALFIMITLLTFFATTIFELAGSTIQPNIATIIIGVTQLVSSIISSCFVDIGVEKVGWLPLVCLVIFGFGLSSAFSYMISGISGHYTFWIFASACALAFVFTVFCVPETKVGGDSEDAEQMKLLKFFRNFAKIFYFCIQDLHKALLHDLHTPYTRCYKKKKTSYNFSKLF